MKELENQMIRFYSDVSDLRFGDVEFALKAIVRFNLADEWEAGGKLSELVSEYLDNGLKFEDIDVCFVVFYEALRSFCYELRVFGFLRSAEKAEQIGVFGNYIDTCFDLTESLRKEFIKCYEQDYEEYDGDEIGFSKTFKAVSQELGL